MSKASKTSSWPSLAGGIDLVEEGVGRYRIRHPFSHEDGDAYHIVLKRRVKDWCITDEGVTFMHLSYQSAFPFDGKRKSILDAVLTGFDIQNSEGELILPVAEEDPRLAERVFHFAQAITKICDTRYLLQEREASHFASQTRSFLQSVIPKDRACFDYWDHARDPDGLYRVDCRVNGLLRPIHFFIITTPSKCKDAALTCMAFDKWEIHYLAVGIFHDESKIDSRSLQQFDAHGPQHYDGLRSALIQKNLEYELSRT